MLREEEEGEEEGLVMVKCPGTTTVLRYVLIFSPIGTAFNIH